MSAKSKKSSPQPAESSAVSTNDLSSGDPTHRNLVVLVGQLSSAPVKRTLPSGDILTQYEVRVRGEGADPATTAPVVQFGDPPSRAANQGDEVLVVGSVRRRFYRAGGSTQSRTEVVASKVRILPTHRTLRAACTAVSESLDELVAGRK